MRVKVGNQWFCVKRGQPIAVELTEADRKNIANMAPDATRYAVIDDDDARERGPDEIRAWLADG